MTPTTPITAIKLPDDITGLIALLRELETKGPTPDIPYDQLRVAEEWTRRKLAATHEVYFSRNGDVTRVDVKPKH